jgi:membrane-associated protease RseP (regulator of RpoE activity)
MQIQGCKQLFGSGVHKIDITHFSSAAYCTKRQLAPDSSMARAEPDFSSGNMAIAILAVATLLLGVAVLVARQLSFDSPASHHARTLLKLDSALGATLEPLDERAVRMLGGGSRVDEMVVTSVAAGGRASAAGLRVGDVVEQVDGKDPSDLDAAIGAISIDPTQIVVNRHGSHVMLNVPGPAATAHG